MFSPFDTGFEDGGEKRCFIENKSEALFEERKINVYAVGFIGQWKSFITGLTKRRYRRESIAFCTASETQRRHPPVFVPSHA